MDHLYTPSQPCRIVNVPFFGHFYDGSDFYLYMIEKDWTRQSLQNVLSSLDTESLLNKPVVDGICFIKRLEEHLRHDSTPNIKPVLLEGKMTLLRALAIANFITVCLDHSFIRVQFKGATRRQSCEQYIQELRKISFQKVAHACRKYGQIALQQASGRFHLTHADWFTMERQLFLLAMFLPGDLSGRTLDDVIKTVHNLGSFHDVHSSETPLSVLYIHPAREQTVRSVLAFIQSWLFFGLLKSVFSAAGIDLVQEAFIHTTEKRLSTVALRGELGVLAARIQQFDANARTQLFLQFEKMTRFSHEYALSIDAMIGNSWLASVALYATAMLSITLRWGSPMIYGLKCSHITSRRSRFIFESCLKAGWCRKQFSTFRNTHTDFMMYYAYLLKESSDPIHHGDCSEDICKWRQLELEPYAIKHYGKDAHETGSCNICSFLALGQAMIESPRSAFRLQQTPTWWPDQQKIIRIIEEGGIPLISVATISEFNIRSTIVEYDDEQIFVAISHVWADGRGNPGQNSLPLCQLYEMLEYLSRLKFDFEKMGRNFDFGWPGTKGWDSRHVTFWIDTICVPLAPQQIRNTAKASMRNVYTNAAAVLVLDNGLMQMKYPENPVDALVSIALSGWSQRLWTFQEATQSVEMVFVFAQDRMISLNALVDEWSEKYIEQTSVTADWKSRYLNKTSEVPYWKTMYIQEISEASARLFGRKGLSEISNGDPLFLITPEGLKIGAMPHELLPWLGLDELLRNDFNSRRRPTLSSIRYPLKAHTSFEILWSAIQGRATTRLNDEFTCIGSLLNLDVIPTIHAPVPHKMKSLLLHLRELPASILFIETDRIREPPFTWAPISFLSHTSASWADAFWRKTGKARVTEYGLKTRLSYLKFPANAQIPKGDTFDIVVALDPRERKGLENEKIQTKTFTVQMSTHLKEQDINTNPYIHGLALILRTPLLKESEGSSLKHAAIVLITSKWSLEITHAQFVLPVRLITQQQKTLAAEFMSMTSHSPEKYPDSGLIIQAVEHVSKPRWWLIT